MKTNPLDTNAHLTTLRNIQGTCSAPVMIYTHTLISSYEIVVNLITEFLVKNLFKNKIFDRI